MLDSGVSIFVWSLFRLCFSAKRVQGVWLRVSGLMIIHAEV